MIAIPARDLVEHVAPFEPAVPQNAGHLAVVQPLAPGKMVVADALQRQSGLAFQREPWPDLIEPLAQPCAGLVERVEKNAVGVDRRDELSQRVDIALSFAARPRVPGIVVDEYAYAACVKTSATSGRLSSFLSVPPSCSAYPATTIPP